MYKRKAQARQTSLFFLRPREIPPHTSMRKQPKASKERCMQDRSSAFCFVSCRVPSSPAEVKKLVPRKPSLRAEGTPRALSLSLAAGAKHEMFGSLRSVRHDWSHSKIAKAAPTCARARATNKPNKVRTCFKDMLNEISQHLVYPVNPQRTVQTQTAGIASGPSHTKKHTAEPLTEKHTHDAHKRVSIPHYNTETNLPAVPESSKHDLPTAIPRYAHTRRYCTRHGANSTTLNMQQIREPPTLPPWPLEKNFPPNPRGRPSLAVYYARLKPSTKSTVL